MDIKIAPSLDCANYANLEADLHKMARGGADIVHIDIMDGHFVPNFTAGPKLVTAVKNSCDMEVETHMQLENPDRFVEMFADCSDIITFHVESTHRLFQLAAQIKDADCKVSLALNPGTPCQMIEHILPRIQMVIMMCVDPGFAGQSFIQEVLPKIEFIREKIEQQNLDIDIAVDGNINKETIAQTKKAGANVFVLGTSSVFKKGFDIEEQTRIFKDYCQQI